MNQDQAERADGYGDDEHDDSMNTKETSGDIIVDIVSSCTSCW